LARALPRGFVAMKKTRQPWHRPCHAPRVNVRSWRTFAGGMSMRARAGFSIAVVVLLATGSATGQFVAKDPGVRNDTSAAGKPLKGLSASQIAFFEAGTADFAEAEIVADGLGPRFNLDSCAGCHIQPAIGGTSPRTTPQVPLAKAFGALNNVPSFIKEDGPIREARYRYKPDGSRDGG